MGIKGKFVTSLVAAALAASIADPASAQSRKRSVDDRVVTSMSGYEVIALMRSLSAAARLTDDNAADDEKTLEARFANGTVYVFLADCNGPGAYAQCGEIQPTVYFSGEGVTLGQLNRFNLDESTQSVAGLLEDGRGVVFVRRKLNGGVTASHVRWTLRRFLRDAESLLGSIDPSGAPAVRLPASSVLSPARGTGASHRLSGVGANAPTFRDGDDGAAKDAAKNKVSND